IIRDTWRRKPSPAWQVLMNDGEPNPRSLFPAGVHANSGLLHLRGHGFALAALQIARKIGEEAGRDLHPDPVSLLKHVTGDQVFQSQFVNLVWFQQLPSSFEVAVTGAQDIEPRTHQVEGRSIRRD